MIKETISIDDAIQFLNEALEADPGTVNKLLKVAVPLEGEAFLDSKVIQGHYRLPFLIPSVSPFGFFVGMFGSQEGDNFAPICYEVDENKNIVKFKRSPSFAERMGEVKNTGEG